MSLEQDEIAGVVAQPSLIYGSAVALGLILHRLFPLRLMPNRSRSTRRRLGVLIVSVGIAHAVWGVVTMLRHGDNPDPSYPVVSLVSDGPFRISRNPIYLALTTCYLGTAVLIGTVWHLILLPPLLTIMQQGVVRREEAYLERRFGDEYRAYRARVRRWL